MTVLITVNTAASDSFVVGYGAVGNGGAGVVKVHTATGDGGYVVADQAVADDGIGAQFAVNACRIPGGVVDNLQVCQTRR